MEKYYQVRVKVQHQDEKATSELYLVMAVSVTDAEQKITAHLMPSDFQVTAVTETKILEVIG
jgi:hypothetical protein